MKITQISFSSLNEYLNYCPLKYYFRKILNLQPEFTTVELVYGSGFHNSMEAFLVSRLEGGDMTLKEMVDLFAASFDDPKIRYNGQSKDELILEGAELLAIGREHDYGKILGVEVPVEIKIADDLVIEGFIDLLTESESRRKTISDFKTAKKRPSAEELTNHQQLSTYSLAYPSADLRLLVFLKQKTPSIDIFETWRTQEQRNRIVKTYLQVREAMEKECWYPREGFWCCGCGYREQCKKAF